MLFDNRMDDSKEFRHTEKIAIKLVHIFLLQFSHHAMYCSIKYRRFWTIDFHVG